MSSAAAILVGIVRAYRVVLSPILPFNQCRFLPTCSEYAIEALTKHGAWRGTGLAARRILRCHPYSKYSGFDPVP